MANGKIKPSTEYVAYLNGYMYSTLQYAIEDSSNGDVITLINDASLQYAIIQNKNITIDMDGYYLGGAYSDSVAIVYNSDVTFKNGTILNVGSGSALMAIDGSDVYLEEIGFSTAGYEASAVIAGASDVALYDCTFLNGSIMENAPSAPCGVSVLEDATVVVELCMFAFDDGIGLLVGEGGIVGSYYNVISATEGVAIGLVNGGAYIEEGNYIAANPLLNSGGYAEIYAGLFEAEYYGTPAITGTGSNNGTGIELSDGSIATPTDWKTVDRDAIAVYRNMAKPGSTKVNLSSKYNTIKATWNGVSGADGYLVYYKKGSNSYKLWGKTSKKTATIKNLTAGAKYTVKIVPYKNIEGMYTVMEGKGTKYSTAYTYTLKKVVLNKFTKSNGKVKVAWKNISGETGYQISKSTKKSGTNIVATYKTTTGKTKLISATKGKNYYYKVRAYKVVNGKKIYGPWSTAKKFKR